jgi:hypothetical protein
MMIAASDELSASNGRLYISWWLKKVVPSSWCFLSATVKFVLSNRRHHSHEFQVPRRPSLHRDELRPRAL